MNTEDTQTGANRDQPSTPGAGGPTGGAPVPPKPKQAKWFWGVVIVLAVVSLLLTQSIICRQPCPTCPSCPTCPTCPTNPPDDDIGSIELSSWEIKALLDAAKSSAYDACHTRIDGLLNQAYRPVHAQIPAYKEFHYSVWNEYVELWREKQSDLKIYVWENFGSKYFGLLPEVQSQWQQHIQDGLTNGLEAALYEALQESSDCLVSEFERQVKIELAQFDPKGIGFDLVTQKVIDLAIDRVRKRVTSIADVPTTSGTATLQGAASIIAEEIATKFVDKGAAKLVANAAASGIGTMPCVWADPFTVSCEVENGERDWLGVHKLMVEADTLMSQGEFEGVLRDSIGEHKEQVKGAFGDAAQKLLSSQSIPCPENAEFTLQQPPQVCTPVTDLTCHYNGIKDTPASRTPEWIGELRGMLNDSASECPLVPLVREMQENIGEDKMRVKLVQVSIKGNLPSGHQSDKDVSGILMLNDMEVPLSRTATTNKFGFRMTAFPDWSVPMYERQQLTMVLELDLLPDWTPGILRWRFNKSFVGGAMLESAFKKISQQKVPNFHYTTTAKFNLRLAEDVYDKNVSWGGFVNEGTPEVTVELEFEVEQLPGLRQVPQGCQPITC